MSRELQWLRQSAPNAPRIPDETWENMKPIILEQYQNNSLEHVMAYMKEHHDFQATKRQYIHRIGNKWQHKKYLPVRPTTPRSSPEKRALASGLPGPDQGMFDVFPNTEYVTMEIGSILPHNGTEMDATPVLTQSSKEKITELSVNSTELHPSTL